VVDDIYISDGDVVEVLWLGSKYQVDRITVRHVPVLSSSVQVVDSARDLGVVIDSHLHKIACSDTQNVQ